MLIVSLIFLQVVIFAGLIVIFRKVLNNNVSQATKHLEELGQDYNKKERELSKQLEGAKQKSKDMLAQARGEADKQRAQIIKDAEAERDKIFTQARTQSEEIMQQADKSRQSLLSELEDRIAKEAVNKACELIQRTLPEHFKQGVHSQWTDELIENSFSKLDRLNIPEKLREVKLSAAFPLREEQRKNLSKKLKQILGRSITLKEEIDKRLVAGVIVTIGSLVLDGSLKNKIQEQAEGIKCEDGK